MTDWSTAVSNYKGLRTLKPDEERRTSRYLQTLDRLDATAALTSGSNQDTEARAAKAAAEHQAPLHVVRQDQSQFPEIDPGPDTQSLAVYSPETARMVGDVDMMRQTRDDVDNMGLLERQTAAVASSWGKSYLNVAISDLSRKEMFDEGFSAQDERDLQHLKYLQRKALMFDAAVFGDEPFEGLPTAVGRFLRDVPRLTAETLPLMGIVFGRAWDETLLGGAAGATVGAVAGSVVPGAGTVAGAASGAATGLRLGFKTGVFIESARVEMGFAWDNFKDLTDESGEKLDRDTVRGAAVMVGVINGGLEALGSVKLARVMPGLDKMVGFANKKAMRRLLRVPSVRTALGNFGRRVLSGMAWEGMTEAVQELVSVIGEAALTKEMPEAGPTLERIAMAGRAGAGGGGGIAIAGGGVQLPVEIVKARQAQANATLFSDLSAAAQNSKTAARLPAVFREHLAQVQQETGSLDVTVDAEALQTYFQEVGVTEEVIATEMPELADSMAESRVTGAEVSVSMADLGQLAAQPQFEKIIPAIRARPDQMTLAEAEQMVLELEAAQQEQQAEADAAPAKPLTIHENVMQQLVENTGMPRDQAEADALVISAAFETQAARMGVDAQTLWERVGLGVRSEVPGQETATALPEADVEIAGQKDVRPATENAQQVAEASFENARVLGDRQVPLQSLQGGVDLQQPSEQKRVADLVAQITGPEGYWSRIIVDTEGNVLEGQHRLEAARELGVDSVPATVVQDLDQAYDTTAMLEAARAAGLRGDQARSLVRNVLEMLAEDPEAELADYDVPTEFREAYDAVLAAAGAPTVLEQRVQRYPTQGLHVPDRVEEGASLPQGLQPAYRVVVPDSGQERQGGVLAGTTNQNAGRQIEALDRVLAAHPDTSTPEKWAQAVADALGTNDVPMPPWRFLQEIKDGTVEARLAQLTPGQLADADHGFENARRTRQLLIDGTFDVRSTTKLFLWSFLSRGVSPYTQEGLFLDAFVAGIDPWIEQAAAGNLDLDGYLAWAAEAAGKGQGRPGAGASHNLNAFGKDFLRKMSEDAGDGTGRSKLQVIHDMMADPEATGQQIRRRFLELGEGVGIDNKVVSFTLLVAGFEDVMVIDRVQARQLFDDGRFAHLNIYDGAKADGKVITGSSFAKQFDGVKGLVVYEMIERMLMQEAPAIYKRLGRPQDGYPGRYHWETWVAWSAQEASHGSLGVILAEAEGAPDPIEGVHVKQGEYAMYDYGMRYGRTGDGQPYFLYTVPQGNTWVFTPEQKQRFTEEIKKPANGVVPKDFKVSEETGGPWYARPEINQARLNVVARETAAGPAGRRAGTVRLDGKDRPLAPGPAARYPGLFEQGAADGRRGYIKFGQARDYFEITLTGKANLSTFLHEAGHFHLEFLARLAQMNEATAQQRQDLETILDWLGVKPGEQVSREQHERFARGFEAYLMEGKAPSAKLAAAFRRFRQWLLNIYKSMLALDVELTPEVRGVMDRLLASDVEIDAAVEQNGFQPAFETAEQAGMTADQFAAYLELWNQAVGMAENRLDSRLLAEILKARSKEQREARREIRAEVAIEVAARPVYAAQRAIRGIDDPPQGWPEGAPLRLARAAVAEIDKNLPQALGGLLARKNETGAHPDDVAPYFGFRSGGDMVEAIAVAVKETEAVAVETERRMQATFGDMLVDAEARSEAAARAMHIDSVSAFLVHELQMLNKRAGGKDPQPTRRQALQEAARDAVQRIPIFRLRPDVYRQAERKFALASRDAVGKGNLAEAVEFKQQQILNHFMEKEAAAAREAADKMRNYLKRFDRAKVRARVGKTDPSYLQQIDNILEGIAFPKEAATAIQDRQDLAAWIAQKSADGEPVMIDTQALATIQRKNYRELTLAELSGIHDAVKNIEHLARHRGRLQIQAERRFINDVITDIEASAEKIRRPVGEDPLITPGLLAWMKDKARFARAAMTKPEFLFKWLDGNTYGAAQQHIFRPLVEAQTAEADMLRKLNKDLFEAVLDAPRAQRARWNATVDFLGVKLKGHQVIAVALNIGNQSNLMKLAEGYASRGWTEQKVMDALNAWMEKADWDLVQHIWDQLETLRDPLFKVHERATGLKPSAVQAQPVVTPHGTYRGGYYPVKYAPGRVRDAISAETASDQLGLFENNFFKPEARSGATHGRTNFVGPVYLSLDVLPQHVTETVHYITHYEAVTQAWKIIRHDRMRNLIVEKFGHQFYATLQPWLQAVANDKVLTAERGLIDATSQHLRHAMSVGAMGYSLSTASMQLLGITTLLDEVGPVDVAAGVLRTLRDPIFMKEVTEKSGEFRHLMTNVDRDVRAAAQRSFGRRNILRNNFIFRHAFLPLVMFQRVINAIGWHAGYRRAIRQGATEQQAIAQADNVVRQTQAGGGLKDLSAVQRGSPTAQLFTLFFTFFNLLYNRFEDIARQAGMNNVPRTAYRLTVLTVLTVVLENFFRGEEPEDDEDYLTWLAAKVALYGVNTLPVVRDVASGVLGQYGYSITPVQGLLENAVRGASAAGDWMFEDEEPSAADTRAMIRGAGAFIPLPSSAGIRAWEYGQRLADGEVEDPIREFVFGAPRE